MSSDAPATRRLRFSLLTLVLLTTIAAMGAALWRMGREVVPLRREVARLRTETGRLTIEDPTRLYAVRVQTSEVDVWRWRIYVPPGKQFYLHAQPFGVPKTGVPPRPNAWGGLPLVDSGEMWLEFRLQPDPASDRQLVGVLAGRNETQVYRTDLEVCERQEDWIKNEIAGRRTESWTGVPQEQRSEPADQPMVLFRMRARKVVVSRNADGKVSGWSLDEIDEPTDGVMIWIDQYEH